VESGDREVKCMSPPGVGHVPVCVVNVGRLCSERGIIFHYEAPEVIKVNPLHGHTIGGNTIFIWGYNFGHFSENIQVYLGGEQCQNVQLVSEGQISCQVPPGVGKNLTVIVETLGSQSTKNNMSQYSYDAPIIQIISPQKYLVPGEQLLVFGSNFASSFTPDPNITLRICDSECMNITMKTLEQLECIIPQAAESDCTVTLEVGNQITTASYQVSYIPAFEWFSPKTFYIAITSVGLGFLIVGWVLHIIYGWWKRKKAEEIPYVPPSYAHEKKPLLHGATHVQYTEDPESQESQESQEHLEVQPTEEEDPGVHYDRIQTLTESDEPENMNYK